MRRFIAKSIGYPLQDLIRKTNIFEILIFLRKSQYWDEEKIRDYQLKKIKMLIAHAYRNVPYYESLFKKIKLRPTDIETVDDIKKIPILTKEILRKENMSLVSRNFNMRYVKKGKTGGTTGAPVLIYKDAINRSFTWASYYRWYEWMGINYYDRTATLWGARTVLRQPIMQKLISFTIDYLQNQLSFNSFNFSDEKILAAYKQLEDFKPLLLNGYLSALLDFATFINRNNLTGVRPIAVSSTTETLLPHHRLFLKNVYNAPVYDQYGCGELSAISYECAAHNGLHVNVEHILCEILDENKKPVTDVKGSVVGTDLDNFVMPFIRYKNGDLSSISSEKCTCGVNQPLMNSIDGRAIDTIELKTGEKVHGVFFTDILYELNIFSDKIQKFQVYQDQPGVIDFKLQCEKALDDKQKKVLLNTLQIYFHKVNYFEQKLLPHENNGKFKYIINSIKSENLIRLSEKK